MAQKEEGQCPGPTQPSAWSFSMGTLFSVTTGDTLGHPMCAWKRGAEPGQPRALTPYLPNPQASPLPEALLGASAQPGRRRRPQPFCPTAALPEC